jgi:CDP-diacylglycerol---glycerol-3-phosphate 3-phosphatidyltransferase
MPSVYDLKPRFQALLRPLMRRLAAAGVTPNAVTLAAVAGSVAVGALLVARPTRWALLAVPVWLFLRMALNAVDGMMARELGMTTTVGAFLNELGDVLSDLALYLPLAVVEPSALWPVVAFAFGAVLTEMTGVVGQALGGGRRYEGPMGKSDRALAIGALALATAVYPGARVLWPWLLAAGTLLAASTCANRARAALRAVAGRAAGRGEP